DGVEALPRNWVECEIYRKKTMRLTVRNMSRFCTAKIGDERPTLGHYAAIHTTGTAERSPASRASPSACYHPTAYPWCHCRCACSTALYSGRVAGLAGQGTRPMVRR